MKKIILLTLLSLSLTACSTSETNEITETCPTANVTGQYVIPEKSPDDGGTVTVSSLPKTVKCFRKLRSEIATTPHGAAACFIIALNMYMENPTVGEACLAMSVTPSQRDKSNPEKLASVGQIIRDRYAPGSKGSSVYSPWIPHCFFKGFVVESGWQKPVGPYQMVFGNNPSKECHNMENNDIFHGYSVPLTVDAFANTTSSQSRYRNVVAVKVRGCNQYVLIDFDNLINTASYKRP